jgi:hypothetical protein
MVDPAESLATRRAAPECRIDAAGACFVGCDADVPKKLVDVAPDLSGINLTGAHGLAIAQILIDERGGVAELCILRGVRDDIDRRAMAAIRQWQFEPVRLRHSTPPGMIVPAVITVSVAIGR